MENKFKYIYLGDRFSIQELKNKTCIAIKNESTGKCIRGRNANMLVRFENEIIHNIPGRRLRKKVDGKF